jgi:hypothetical protein
MICKKKEFGGLRVPDLGNVNMCLLGSEVKIYIKDDGKIWTSLVDAKYNANSPNIFCSKTMGVSQFWKGVMWDVHSINWEWCKC